MMPKDEALLGRRLRSSCIRDVEAHQPAPLSELGDISSTHPASLLPCCSNLARARIHPSCHAQSSGALVNRGSRDPPNALSFVAEGG